MERRTAAEALVRRPPVPNGPTVTVFFGGEAGGPDVGVVRLEVPPGAGVPAHRHNGSDVILVPIEGYVRISNAEGSIDVRPGDCALVRKDEEVSLVNPGDGTARVIVAAGPANFVAGVRGWPQPNVR